MCRPLCSHKNYFICFLETKMAASDTTVAGKKVQSGKPSTIRESNQASGVLKGALHVILCIKNSILLRPYSTQTTNPPNHQELINVRILLDSWRIVKCSTHSVIFYDSDTKQVRNSYEYSRDSAGFGPSCHDTAPNSLRCAITYLEKLK